MLECDPNLPAEEVMEPGPSTVRPDRQAAGVAERLAKQDLRWAIVTDPEGRLLGAAARQDLERTAEADEH
jgi:CBS domain-containing protein